jgi:hypothetical protein
MSRSRITFTDDFVLRNKKVGIGTSVPTSTLTVIGDINATSINAASANIDRIVSPTIEGNLQVEGQFLEEFNGEYYNIVTQIDIGTEPNQVPLNQFLGRMAYKDYPFNPTTSSTANSTSVVINAPTTTLYSHIANFTGDPTIQVANLTSGYEVKMYVRNTNASPRVVTIQASETTADYVDVNLAPGAGTMGAGSTSTVSLASTSGTTLVWVGNINGDIVGGVLA